MRLGSAIIVIWLVFGGIAALQRGYFASSDVNCAQVSTILITVVAGGLNYFGMNPKIDCAVPQASP